MWAGSVGEKEEMVALLEALCLKELIRVSAFSSTSLLKGLL